MRLFNTERSPPTTTETRNHARPLPLKSSDRNNHQKTCHETKTSIFAKSVLETTLRAAAADNAPLRDNQQEFQRQGMDCCSRQRQQRGKTAQLDATLHDSALNR